MAVISLAESLAALNRATGLRTIAKYQQWWLQQPRDEFGKWTSGFASSAFAPSEDKGQAEPPSDPKDNWQNEPGWMGATAQHGISSDHPGLGTVAGDPGSQWLPASHAFAKPKDPDAAEEGAKQLSAHIAAGDFDAAKALVHANPEILYPFRKQHHGSVKAAKSAAAFLNATTDATWVQHGTFVNKPKEQPAKEALPAPAAPTPPEPKSVGAPKLLEFDPKTKPQPGTVEQMKATADAQAIHDALSQGDVASARKIAQANPSALHGLYGMKHKTVLEAKSAAAFLHLMTGKNFAQHGTIVNMPKGATPASSWSASFSGTGAPGYAPPASLTSNTVDDDGAVTAQVSPAVDAAVDAHDPYSAHVPIHKTPPIIPPPGMPAPASSAAQAKSDAVLAAASKPADAFPAAEAKEIAHGKKGGTNPGGFYQLKDGTKGYAKFYSDAEQMQAEVLANSVYGALGINAPKSRLLTIDGKKCVFSPLVENGTQFSGATAESTAKLAAHPQIRAGFAADAILANHDVFGLDHDNVMMTPDGQAHRIDNGSTFKFRAQGATKPFGADSVPELDSMRDPKHGGGKVFGGLTDDDVSAQIVHFANAMTPDKIASLVAEAGFTGDAAKQYAATLQGRTVAAIAWAQEHASPSVAPFADKAASSYPQAAQDAASAPAPYTPPDFAPVGDKLLGSINPHDDLDAANAMKSTAKAGPFKFAGALMNHDEAGFAKAVTQSSAHLAKAAQKTWPDQWPAEQTAKILSHLTGVPHGVIPFGNGYKVGQGIAQPVVAKAPAQLPLSALSGGNAGAPSMQTMGALAEWVNQGEGSAKAAMLDPKALTQLYQREWSTAQQAKAVAGLLSHRTGKHFSTIELSSGKHAVVTSGEPAKPEEHVGQKQGFPNPATYDPATDQKQAGVNPGMTTPKQFDDVAEVHSQMGNHATAAWVKALKQAKFGEPQVPATGATPEQDQAIKDAALAKQINYSDVGSTPEEQHDMAEALDTAFVGAIHNGDATMLDQAVKGAIDDPTHHKLAAIAQMKYGSMKKANALAKSLKDHGIDAQVQPDPDTPSKNRVVMPDGILPQHLASLKPSLAGIHQQKQAGAAVPPTPGATSSNPGDPLFTQPPPPSGTYDSAMSTTYLKNAAKGMPSQKHGLAKSVEKSPATLHYLATAVNTKAALGPIADALDAYSSNFNYAVAKKAGANGVKSYVLRITPKNGAVAPPGGFDAAFQQQNQGPITSASPVGLMALRKGDLPAGVSINDVVRTDPGLRAEKIAQLKQSGNADSAAFLAAAHDEQDKVAAHHLAKSDKIYLGATNKLASPRMRAHEILDQTMNGIGAVMPQGVTPAMLHAANPQERAAAINEAKGQYGETEGSKWLADYYATRDEAADEQKNAPFVAAPTSNYVSSTTNPAFLVPGAFDNFPKNGVNESVPKSLNGIDHGISVPSQKGWTRTHDDALIPQRTAPVNGIDPTHLDLPVGASMNAGEIGKKARDKAESIYDALYAEHQGRRASGSAISDPFGDRPEEGVHVMSQAAHQLAQQHFQPMLESARAAMPSEGVLRALAPNASSSARRREVSRQIFNGLAKKMGIPKADIDSYMSHTQNWLGNGQSTGAMRIRVASNILRGRTPYENVHPIDSHNLTQAEANQTAMRYAKSMTPGYLKAVLLQKAITQAMAERHADQDGDLMFARAINSGSAQSMLKKSVSAAISGDKPGSQYDAHEMTLAGYGPGVTYNGSAVLHRMTKPESLWQSFMFSPSHGSPSGSDYQGENESFIASNGGGPKFTLMDHYPTTKGNFITPHQGKTGSGSTGVYGTQWGPQNLGKMMSALAQRTMIVGRDHGIPVPTHVSDWNRWVPDDWEPSQAHVDAFLPTVTGDDGVRHLYLDAPYESPTV